MLKRKFYRIFLLLVLVGVFIVSGCDNMVSGQTDQTDPATYLVTCSTEEIDRLVNYFKASYIELFDKVENKTDQDAEEVKKEIETLKNNIDKVDLELTSAVENSKITDEAKKEYDKTLESLKTDLDNLNQKLAS